MNKGKIAQIEGRQVGVLLATGLFPPEIGGPATYSALLAEKLPAYGFFVKVLPFSRVRHLPKIIRHMVYFFLCLKESIGMDIVYAQDTVSVGLPAGLSAKILRKKFVIRVVGDHAWEQGRGRFGVREDIDDFQRNRNGFMVNALHYIQRKTTEMTDLIIVPSVYFKSIVSGWIKKESKIKVIYNGIDLNYKVPEGKPYRNRDKIILSAGRLVPWKGFDVLINSVLKMAGWKLYIVGDGPERDVLEKMVADLGAEEKIKFFGAVSKQKLFDLMAEARVFALNSSFESFSFQVVEAMHAGLPTIVTTVGSFPEIIENKKEGVLISPNDEKGIVEAITRIDNYDEVREGFIREAKKKVEQFSIENSLENLSDSLKNLLEN